MRKIMMKTLLLSLVLFLSLASSGMADQKPAAVSVYFVPMNFKFDEKQYAPPQGQQGFIYEGSTYVPLRFVSYSLGKAVKWDGDTYTVTVEQPSKNDLITIDEYNLNTQVREPKQEKLDTSKLSPSTINVYKEKVTYVFDGSAKQPSEELPGFIIDGSLFVPMRFFAESVGKEIGWNPETYTVSAKVQAAEPQKPPVKVPVPTLVPTPVVVPGGAAAGGFGGGGATKPSYESLTAAAKSQLDSLKNKCSSELSTLADQYLKTKDVSLISQGYTKLAACDSSFNAIIADLESRLTANGYSTDILQTYRDSYDQTKSDAIAGLKHRVLSS